MPGLGSLLAEGGQQQPRELASAGSLLTAAPPEAQRDPVPDRFASPPASPPAGGDFSLLRLSPDEVVALEGPLQTLQQAFPNMHISRDRQGVFLLIPSRKKQEFLEIASESGFDPSLLKRIESGGGFK